MQPRTSLHRRPLVRALAIVALLLLFAPAGFTWESCKEAVASQHGANLGKGLNYSILFMLSMVFLIPAAFALAIWNSYRVARLKAAEQQGGAP